MATVYLTFDDGPLYGTDDVIDVLNAKSVKGTLFMVGDHTAGKWSAKQLKRAQDSKLAEVANHSTTHAGGKYTAYYKDPKGVLAGFNKATTTLGITAKPVPARLPGRNTWRLPSINRNDPANGGDSGKAADLLAKNGFRIYGWDVEWRMAKGAPVESPDQIAKAIADAVAKKTTRKPGKVIVLTHDVMFRASKSGKVKLESLVDKLKAAGHTMDFASNY